MPKYSNRNKKLKKSEYYGRAILYEQIDEMEVIKTVDELNAKLDSEGIESLAQKVEKDGFGIITLAYDKYTYHFYYVCDNPDDYWICKVPNKSEVFMESLYQTNLN